MASYDSESKSGWYWVGMFILNMAWLALGVWLFQLVWNDVAVEVFHAPAISFFQAVGLLLLGGLLTSVFNFSRK